MKYLLQILSLLTIPRRTAVGNKLGAHGHEGGELKIVCPYEDGYQHVPKYFCRHPCRNEDVLIRSEKSHTYETSGRFSLYDYSTMREFTVTISKLTPRDSAVYYCGVEKWGPDKKTKVQVTVSRAVPPPSLAPTVSVATQKDRDLPHGHNQSIGTTWITFTGQSMATATQPLPSVYLDRNQGMADSLIVLGAILGVLGCLCLAVFAEMLRRRSRSKSCGLKPAEFAVPVETDEEEPAHVYDECAEQVVYSTIDLPQEESEDGYCTVQFPDHPAGEDENALYSLVMCH